MRALCKTERQLLEVLPETKKAARAQMSWPEQVGWLLVANHMDAAARNKKAGEAVCLLPGLVKIGAAMRCRLHGWVYWSTAKGRAALKEGKP